MNTMKINIDGVETVLKFNYGFLRKLGEAWNCKGPVAVMLKFQEAANGLIQSISEAEGVVDGSNGIGNFDIPFKHVSVFSDILRFAALAENESSKLDPDACSEYVFNNVPEMTQIIKLFMDSMPILKEQDLGKPTPGKEQPEPAKV